MKNLFDSILIVSGIIGGMMFMYGSFLISIETGFVFVGLFLYFDSKFELNKKINDKKE